MVRLKDIAEATGASISTVSLILNGRGKELRISEALAEEVRRVAKDMGYRPMSAARAVRSNKAGQVGFMVMNTGIGNFRECFHPAYEMILGAAERMESEGYFVLVFRQDELLGKSKSRLLKERVVDGVVVSGYIQDDCVAALRSSFSKIVWLDTMVWDEFSSIRRDETLSGRLAAKALLDSGYRRIAWFGPRPGNHYSAVDRFEGARAEAVSRGAEFLDLGFKYDSSPEDRGKACQAALEDGAGFVAYGFMEARILASTASSFFGLSPGWHYGLAACDESWDLKRCWPMLTRVANDRYSAGALAAEMLVKAIDGSPAPSLVLKDSLVEGSTSKRLSRP